MKRGNRNVEYALFPVKKRGNNPVIPPRNVPLVAVYRGELIETVHNGSIAVVESTGRLLLATGDAEQMVYLRSGAKPFQLLPLIEAGAADRFAFPDEELAVMAGSHGGEPEHTKAVASILRRAGLVEADLRCGTHRPFHRETAEKNIRAGREPTVLQNNCSGKHAGMLALARHLGAGLGTYTEPDHPVQRLCLEAVARCCDHPAEAIPIGRDGCSVPTFALPLWKTALGYARLVEPGAARPPIPALGRIAAAMRSHPFMVAGTGRLGTDLMRELGSRILVKVGANGFIAAGFHRDGHGVGLAVKMAAGESGRIRAAAILEVVARTGEFPAVRIESVRRRQVPPVRTHRGAKAGRVVPVFRLESP